MVQGKRLTLKELAEQIGVSTATLDRVLNNRGNVKPETYRMVMEKIKELNYMPNKSASFLSRKQQLRFAVVFPEHPDYFWTQIEKGVMTAYEELRDYGLLVRIFKSEKYDLEKQQEKMLEIIRSGEYDAIAVAPSNSQEMEDIIDKGIDAGIAICTFNNDAPLSKRLFYVGCDYRIAGRLAADVLCKFVGGGKRVGLITSDTSSKSSSISFQMQQKITGFREVVAERGDMELIGPLKLSQEDYGNPELFGEFFAGVDGVYVASAKLSVVAKYLADQGLAGKLPLVGHDMSEEIYEGLQQGSITATIGQDPQNQGYTTIKTLFTHLAFGEKVARSEMITKLELIVKENAQYYI
jgi:LacI family transcriptional regulator